VRETDVPLTAIHYCIVDPIAIYFSRITILSTPPAFDVPVMEVPVGILT